MLSIELSLFTKLLPPHSSLNIKLGRLSGTGHKYLAPWEKEARSTLAANPLKAHFLLVDKVVTVDISVHLRTQIHS